MARKSLTGKKRAAFFAEHDGVCFYCNGKIQPSEKWEAAHIGKDRALRLLRDRYTGKEEWADPDIDPDDPKYQAPAHKKCHAGHTFSKDGNSAISKANRLWAKHNGFHQPTSKIPQRADPWNKNRRPA